jgi:hypothetical protein
VKSCGAQPCAGACKAITQGRQQCLVGCSSHYDGTRDPPRKSTIGAVTRATFTCKQPSPSHRGHSPTVLRVPTPRTAPMSLRPIHTWVSRGKTHLIVSFECFPKLTRRRIYSELGPGKRVSLSKLASENFRETQRPLRIAVDFAIWQFQAQAARGTWFQLQRNSNQ